MVDCVPERLKMAEKRGLAAGGQIGRIVYHMAFVEKATSEIRGQGITTYRKRFDTIQSQRSLRIIAK